MGMIEEYITKHESTEYGDSIGYVQPLVRCKDCKHKGNSFECVLDRDLEEHGSFRTDRHDDWFCADGERKSNEMPKVQQRSASGD